MTTEEGVSRHYDLTELTGVTPHVTLSRHSARHWVSAAQLSSEKTAVSSG